MSERPSKELQARLGYAFKDPTLLELALTHSSATVEALTDNERLEFLGDAVLSLVVSEQMVREMPQCDEGALTRLRSGVVSTATLARCARRLELQRYALLGRGMRPDEVPASVFANLTESLIAAVYLDGGLEAARAAVRRITSEEYRSIVEGEHDTNYKSVLQQHAQKELGQPPQYRLLREVGPDHDKVFVVSAIVGDVAYPPGDGPNKKAAEQRAAMRALRCMGVETTELQNR